MVEACLYHTHVVVNIKGVATSSVRLHNQVLNVGSYSLLFTCVTTLPIKQ